MAVDANLVRAIRGPITLITLGVLFTFDHFTPYGFGQTWPVLLIVFGLLSLLRRGSVPPVGPPPDAPWPPPPGTWPPPPGPWVPPSPPAGGGMGGNYSGSGGYRQSTYGAGQTGSGSSPSGPGDAAGGSQ